MTETIKQTITDLLKAMDLEAAVDIDASDQRNIVVNIETQEAGFLIGQGGDNLKSLQHLARILVNKKLGFPAQFVLDINNYQKQRISFLKEMACQTANQVLNEKAPLFLQPMSSYERRIIHLALADYPEIETESAGQEPDRRITIKPRP